MLHQNSVGPQTPYICKEDIMYCKIDNKVGHLLSESWCRICAVEFYLAKLLVRCRKFQDRIRVPTVDDQPLWLYGDLF